MKKRIVAILSGGRSSEHEVSLNSAKNVIGAINKKMFTVIHIIIDKSGMWSVDGEEVVLRLGQDIKQLLFIKSNKMKTIDVIFPVLHGVFGEDGTVQGLCKLANLPFVGPGVLGSSVSMDKDITKRLLRDSGINVAKWIVVDHRSKNISWESITSTLGNIVFVKPANAGSSVGVHKVENEKELVTALKDAFQFDTKVLIEEAIVGKEIECSVMGNEEITVSLPGEVVPSHSFYDYKAKYLDENGAALVIPAQLEKVVIEKLQETAKRVFHILCCEGMARVDFFVTKTGKLYVNEVNTIPGFTNISMYPKLWEASGLSYTNLITNLLTLAIKRFERESKLKTSYI